MSLPILLNDSLHKANIELKNSDLFSLNSSSIGPNKYPSDAKACPPQFSPDSILCSEIQMPFLAKNFACVREDLKSETFIIIRFLRRPFLFG